MTVNTIEERKRYINEIKASFQDPTLSQQYRDFSEPKEEPAVKTGYFKLRFFVAIALFAIFVYCDQNQITFKTHTTKEVYKIIEETTSLEKMIETIKEIP